MPDFPVHHQLSELAQIHVHRISDAIQPSHPLSSPSPPTFNLAQQNWRFKWPHFSISTPKFLLLYFKFTVNSDLLSPKYPTLNSNKDRAIGLHFLSTCDLTVQPLSLPYLPDLWIINHVFSKFPDGYCWGMSWNYNKNHKGWSSHRVDSDLENTCRGSSHAVVTQVNPSSIPSIQYHCQ